MLRVSAHVTWGSAAAWTYLALHGSYGYLWIVKVRKYLQ
ncbi:unnamed protein product [Ectocarpus sp. 8 AP-2014]